MDFTQFKSKHQVKDQQLYEQFYTLFSTTIGIKNKKIAVQKLQIIIQATFKLSASQSFSSMSLRQLSNETQISMGGLYAYIKNKQQLSLYIHQFLNYFVEKTLSQIDSNINNKPLERIIKYHVYLSEIMRPWFFFAFMESKNLDQKQKKYAIQSELMMESILIKTIEECQNKGYYSCILSAETIASHIKPLLHDWYLKRWKYNQRNISIDDFCYSVMIFINRGLMRS